MTAGGVYALGRDVAGGTYHPPRQTAQEGPGPVIERQRDQRGWVGGSSGLLGGAEAVRVAPPVRRETHESVCDPLLRTQKSQKGIVNLMRKTCTLVQ